MGSLCCVAARPHGSGTASREWSIGGNEPFWRTNSSFSPPLSRRWEQRLNPEGLSYGSQDDGAMAIYASSLSSSSKGSRSWVRGEQIPNHPYSVSGGGVSYFSSPSDSYESQQLTPPPLQGVHIDDYVCTMREPPPETRAFSHVTEGTSGIPNSFGSVSSRSDGSDSEFMSKTNMNSHSHNNLRSCYSFLLKPVHPLSFPMQTPEGEEASGLASSMDPNRSLRSNLKSIQALNELQSPSGSLDSGTPQREAFGWSSSSSIDYTDVSELLEPERPGFLLNNKNDCSKCGLCERYLSQRSPWSSRRIVRSGDMPIAAVLACRHVYHVECLERNTHKTQKHDPPCPLCEKTDNIPEQWAVCRLKNGLPRHKSLGEAGPSRSWSCGQVGDCVEGALQAPPRNSMLILNRVRLKKHLSFKAGNSGKERVEKSKKTGLSVSHGVNLQKLADQGSAGCSGAGPGSTLNRW